MNLKDQFRDFIIKWNNKFPLDKWWRDKYKIPFGSEQHLFINQIDILFEYLEGMVYDESVEKYKEKIENEKLLSAGIWLKESADEMTDEDFDNIKIEV